jgi:nitroimidazol reductase NimA-like FMN-containing flavoprotein (pyridoxamine 5'-phosphate oxidase superfamily)
MDPALTEEITSILDDANDMTIATVREDGYPQATTVSYVNDGLKIYFGCAADSQKAKNLARNGKVSLTVNLPYSSWNDIRGAPSTWHLQIVGKRDGLSDARRYA